LIRKLDPNSPVCVALRQKIQNIQNDIARQTENITYNWQGLPYLPPYPGAPPSMSVSGHEGLLQLAQANLAQKQEQYDNTCGCDDDSGSQTPQPAPSPDSPSIPETPTLEPAPSPATTLTLGTILLLFFAILAAPVGG
jgi:hypothetical protein